MILEAEYDYTADKRRVLKATVIDSHGTPTLFSAVLSEDEANHFRSFRVHIIQKPTGSCTSPWALAGVSFVLNFTDRESRTVEVTDAV